MMKILILLLGITFLFSGFKLIISKKDIVNNPKLENKSQSKGSSSLFDQIVNDDFKDNK